MQPPKLALASNIRLPPSGLNICTENFCLEFFIVCTDIILRQNIFLYLKKPNSYLKLT